MEKIPLFTSAAMCECWNRLRDRKLGSQRSIFDFVLILALAFFIIDTESMSTEIDTELRPFLSFISFRAGATGVD